jgi:hypothetical protein
MLGMSTPWNGPPPPSAQHVDPAQAGGNANLALTVAFIFVACALVIFAVAWMHHRYGRKNR